MVTWNDCGSVWCWCVFFFKQKTAYEMLRSLVGSEMCIRDSLADALRGGFFMDFYDPVLAFQGGWRYASNPSHGARARSSIPAFSCKNKWAL